MYSAGILGNNDTLWALISEEGSKDMRENVQRIRVPSGAERLSELGHWRVKIGGGGH